MIVGTDLEQAEQALIRSRAIVPASSVLYDRARLMQEAGDNFVGTIRDDLRKKLPNLDPRFEPILNTLFRHCLLVGCVAGREDQRRSGDAA